MWRLNCIYAHCHDDDGDAPNRNCQAKWFKIGHRRRCHRRAANACCNAKFIFFSFCLILGIFFSFIEMYRVRRRHAHCTYFVQLCHRLGVAAVAHLYIQFDAQPATLTHTKRANERKNQIVVVGRVAARQFATGFFFFFFAKLIVMCTTQQRLSLFIFYFFFCLSICIYHDRVMINLLIKEFEVCALF